jgi:hypothetical protein
MKKHFWVWVAALIGASVIIVIVADIFVSESQPHIPVASTEAPAASSTVPAEGSAPGAGTVPSADKDASCEAALEAQVKSNDTQYDSGTILVTFVSSASIDDANTALAKYSFTADYTPSTEAAFTTDHTLTVDVPSGKEVASVCLIEADPLVRKASLNTIFSLHD